MENNKNLNEISSEELEDVSGGMRYTPYYDMVRRVWNTEMRLKTKAKCPCCGAPFSAITDSSDISHEELTYAQHGKWGWILCRSCNTATNSEEWF